ncbi:WD repeat-containing protein NCU09302/NCU11420 [Lasiosphaeris hirsuta]|uniref:DNA damage-binding protein CMR1 n=1 Tax=Lasiosphaeris hirsuta TaxID=260670 RepID=A0AA40AZI9_9PEZI|nr:WD repeat-containing protein NCU09302/NCU11420 [Lasiosphaeris hirsuta]
MPPKKEAVMSAFERKRLENIANNNAILSGISTAADKIVSKPAPPKSKPKRPSAPRVKREQPKREVVRPTRQSSRLAGLDADSEVLKRKAEVEAENETEKAKAKKMRVSGDLNLGDIKVEGRKWESSVDGMARLKGLALPARGAQPGVRTFTDEDVKGTTDKGLKDLRLRMSGLKLYETWPVSDIKIVPQRVYSMGFHPTEDKPIIFAGDKEGAMGVFDASQEPPEVDDDEDELAIPDPVISAFKTHSRTITAFHFSPADENAVFTASYDSSIRKLDLDKGVSTVLFAPADADEDLPISAIDMPATDPNIVIFSTLGGALGRHDARTKTADAEIWGLTQQKIGGFSLHPAHPHLVATASLDRTLKIWDLRKITGKGEMRYPALLGEHESRLSVSHASWSSGGHIATSSYDDRIKIYSFPDAGEWTAGQNLSEKQMAPVRQITHNNQTGRWVTILKPQWHKRPQDGLHRFVIGNMNRFVDVYAANGEQLAQLGGDGITAVPAVAHFHPTLDWVAGGNASGKLCLWM